MFCSKFSMNFVISILCCICSMDVNAEPVTIDLTKGDSLSESGYVTSSSFVIISSDDRVK